MPGLTPRGRPSKITIPPKAHPFARLVFHEMSEQGVTYEELEWRSNVLISTFKAWRCQGRPGLETTQAALGSLGWELVPVPRKDRLPMAIQEGLDSLVADWKRDEPLLHQLLATCCLAPVLPTKRPKERTRLAHCLAAGTTILSRGFPVELAQPIEVEGQRISSVTIRVRRAESGGGDFKAAFGCPSVSELTGLSRKEAAQLSAEDAANILAVGKAAMAVAAAAPTLISATKRKPRARCAPALAAAA